MNEHQILIELLEITKEYYSIKYKKNFKLRGSVFNSYIKYVFIMSIDELKNNNYSTILTSGFPHDLNIKLYISNGGNNVVDYYRKYFVPIKDPSIDIMNITNIFRMKHMDIFFPDGLEDYIKYYSKMKRFIEEIVGVEVREDLDLNYPFYGDNDDNEVIIPFNELEFVEAPSIDIDEVISILNKLKNNGANRVYIADHADHHGYYFYGVELKEI